MIAIDTSSMIAYFEGAQGRDIDSVETALDLKQAVLPPAVVTELFSDPILRPEVRAMIGALPQLQILAGYWERAGEIRGRLIGRGLKAHLADTLIAQACIDHDLPLITRDQDFRKFARYGLLLA